MKNDVFVAIPLDLYVELASKKTDVQTVIVEYLKKQEPAQPPKRKPAKGITWKPLFLPNGTRFKMTYGGKDHFARVVKGELIYAGEAMSPSIFARRAAANTSRNAWLDIYIKLPKETEWKLADDMRRAAFQHADSVSGKQQTEARTVSGSKLMRK